MITRCQPHVTTKSQQMYTNIWETTMQIVTDLNIVGDGRLSIMVRTNLWTGNQGMLHPEAHKLQQKYNHNAGILRRPWSRRPTEKNDVCHVVITQRLPAKAKPTIPHWSWIRTPSVWGRAWNVLDQSYLGFVVVELFSRSILLRSYCLFVWAGFYSGSLFAISYKFLHEHCDLRETPWIRG